MPSDLIDSYSSYQRSESRSDRTIDDRKRILSTLDQELPYGIEGTSEEELRDWLWRDGLSLSSRETYYGAIADFYKWAAAEGHFEFNPVERITRPKPPQRLPRPVTDEQLTYALACAREPYLTFIKLAAYAGERCIDIAHQRRELISEQAVSIVQSKGGKARVVPTHPVIWEAVRDLPQGPVTGLDERQISISTANYFSRTLKMPGVTLHRFRHWFGTMVQRLYKDLRVTQELMGHADPRTTAGYALVAAEQTRAAIDLLPDFSAALAAAGLAAAAPRSLR
ncbi:tyrosine-type recombinase/integrase [Catelliglobosispora koreensis]|uniref:tyrosine-type recombinase/integrase n=1 Tax=Catelliglobosispora koreensis TaxID=129052 RepID=UPI0003701D22|nr:tyrosine-type recombinase/integrase [Catelliglobosispora koreensis]